MSSSRNNIHPMKSSASHDKNDDWLEGDVSEPEPFDEIDDNTYNSRRTNYFSRIISLLERIPQAIAYCFAFMQYHFVHNRLEFILGSALVVVIVLGLTGIITAVEHRQFHQQLEAAGITTDLTEIKSKFDLKIGSIDNWCLLGGKDVIFVDEFSLFQKVFLFKIMAIIFNLEGYQSCESCLNPLEPVSGDKPHWRKAHEKNIHMMKHFFEAHGTSMGDRRKSIRSLLTQTNQSRADDDFFLFLDDLTDDDMNDGLIHQQISTEHNFTNTADKSTVKKVDPHSLVDIVFLGANTTEAMVGRVLGRKNQNFEDVKQYFETNFDKSKGADYSALSLGIHGDTSANILWRILNGELPSNLKPKLIWLTMGLDDLVSTSCSADITLMGILRVVEELQSTRPDSKIVINSILPYSVDPLGYLEGWRKQKSDRIDYWKAIKSVNDQLETFAHKHKNVDFFDASPLFTQWSGKTLMMKGTAITRRGPQQDGYKMLIDAQLDKIRSLISPTKEQVITSENNQSSEKSVDDITDDFFEYYGGLDDDYLST